MSNVPGYLIEYNRRTHANRVTEFASLREAMRRRLELEAERGDPDVEIAAVSSRSLETLQQTHSRYFVEGKETIVKIKG